MKMEAGVPHPVSHVIHWIMPSSITSQPGEHGDTAASAANAQDGAENDQSEVKGRDAASEGQIPTADPANDTENSGSLHATTLPAQVQASGSGISSDPTRDARIAARRSRIEASRMAKMKPDLADENTARRKPKAEQEQKETGKSKAQVATSWRRIDSVKMAGTELITNIRVGLVAREATRRQEEDRKLDIWDHKRDEESTKSSAMHAVTQGEWDKVAKIGGPFKLFEMLSEQKEACDQLIAAKNRLINEYVAELKGKDDDYVKELKRQAEEIDLLLERMESQYNTFQSTLAQELEQIEKSFVEERTELIDTDLAEIESILTQRRENEGKFMEERAERIEDHIQQLERLRIHDAEEYNLVKIKLETDVQVLEQQLQQMRATYQLNAEKLEYNFQVLKKREEENGTILGTQKRKIARLSDHLNMLRTKIAKQEKGSQQEYMSLTEDYKRITEQFKELQKKFRHFQLSDNKKYREIWKMNEEMTRELMRKVLQADRVVHEQQLGLHWSPPDESLLRSMDGNQIASTSVAKHSKDGASAVVEPTTIPLENSFAAAVTAVADESIWKDGHRHHADGMGSSLKDMKGYSKTMKKVLELLCNEAGFLVEDKLQRLLAPLHKDEQSLIKLDSIFKALGVETVDDIEKLTRHFMSKENTLGISGADGEELNPNDDNMVGGDTLPQLIHPNEVVRALRRFVEENRTEHPVKEEPEMNNGESDNESLVDTKTLADGEEERDDLQATGSPEATADSEEESLKKKLLADVNGLSTEGNSKMEAQRQYWERMSGVLDDRSFRIWKAVYAAMESYHDLLNERWSIAQEIRSISNQNEELKNLLRGYMSAKVNEDLQVPPTQILLAQAGMLPSSHNIAQKQVALPGSNHYHHRHAHERTVSRTSQMRRSRESSGVDNNRIAAGSGKAKLPPIPVESSAQPW
ncbi:sperm tail-domain-containing protein [Cladochytrium replicatum]|nr:sperm tail-domain-containing protein [Cladochytrium replicatum]